MSKSTENNDGPGEPSETVNSEAKEEESFRTPMDKVKFGLEIAVMAIVGFLCIYPLSLFLGNFLR
ncbi:MAG: hypothetical protein ACTSYI_02910 [Promethearchaeota archaeon]